MGTPETWSVVYVANMPGKSRRKLDDRSAVQREDHTISRRVGTELGDLGLASWHKKLAGNRDAGAELPESLAQGAIENHACVARHRATRGTVHPGWQWLGPPSSTGALVEGEVAAVGLVARSGARVGCARTPGRHGLQCGAVARAID